MDMNLLNECIHEKGGTNCRSQHDGIGGIAIYYPNLLPVNLVLDSSILILFQKERKPPGGACFFPNFLACLGVILLHVYYKEEFTYSSFTHGGFDSQRLALRSHISEHYFL